MLGTRGRLQHFLVPLQPFYKGNAKSGRQIGILAIRLLSPAPAGIPKDVYIGRPEGQPLVDARSSLADSIVFCSALRGYDIGNPMKLRFVKVAASPLAVEKLCGS